MIFNIRVVPRSSRLKVEEENGVFKVHLTKPAVDNLANEQLIEVLARHFGVKKYQLRIISGDKSRNKIVEVS